MRPVENSQLKRGVLLQRTIVEGAPLSEETLALLTCKKISLKKAQFNIFLYLEKMAVDLTVVNGKSLNMMTQYQ